MRCGDQRGEWGELRWGDSQARKSQGRRDGGPARHTLTWPPCHGNSWGSVRTSGRGIRRSHDQNPCGHVRRPKKGS
jgi:hypothetical protein